MNRLLDIFTPCQPVPSRSQQLIWLAWALSGLVLWQFWPSDVLPRPSEVAQAFGHLWMTEGLGQQLAISYTVQLEALGIAMIGSLLLAYSATIPVMRPLVEFISTWRFISLGPLVIFFSLMITSEGHALKVWLLVFAIAVFYVTSMIPVVLDVPTEELDHARTLRMNPWQVTREVIVFGRLDVAMEMLRQNAAMGWMMLTMVEGLVRSEGGIGTLLLNQLKHFRLAEVAAIIIVLFAVGFVQDILIQTHRHFLFPYADLEKERR